MFQAKHIIGAALTALALGGCAQVYDTNRGVNIPTPAIASTNSVADIRVGAAIRGTGCASEFLFIFKGGDDHFLELYGQGSSGVVAKAKAAAAYNALVGPKGLSTDIIVHPIWEVTDVNHIISHDVCARVVGYRGTVEGFHQDGTVTHEAAPLAKSVGFLARFAPF